MTRKMFLPRKCPFADSTTGRRALTTSSDRWSLRIRQGRHYAAIVEPLGQIRGERGQLVSVLADWWIGNETKGKLILMARQ